MRKKLMMLVTAVAAAFGVWAETETVGGYIWTYRNNGDTAEIFNGYSAAISPKPTGTVTIPSTLGGKPVTSIGDYAFYDCSGLTSVTIPDSVTNIGHQAFYECRGLTSVTIGNSVTSIDSYAFGGCRGLTSFTVGDGNANYKSVNRLLLSKDGKTLVKGINGDVVVPDGVTSIGQLAFDRSDGLTSVTMPDSVTSIGNNAFYGCSGLTSVTIPDSVTSIGGWAFYGCSGLTSVTIPDSVTSIEWGAFDGCVKLMSISVGSGNDSYKSVNGLLLSKDGKTLVQGVNGDVVVPDGVTSIGQLAFYGCDGLTSVTIPNSVTNIGDSAFGDCSGLTSVTIGEGVTRIGGNAFSGCSGLISFIVGSGNANYKAVNGLLLTKDGKTLVQGVNGDVVVPDGVTSIGQLAFDRSDGLTSVTMPDSVTNLAEYVFQYCWGLSSVVFHGDCPQSVASSIYEGAYNLTTYVSRYASGWGDALSAGTWRGRPIALLDLADDEPPFDSIENPDGTVTLKEYKGIAVEEIYIPSCIGGRTVSAIAGHAFESCSGLQSITIPATVTWLEDEAFAGCSSLVSVTYLGDAPDTGANIYKGTPRTLVSYVTGGTIGWSGGISAVVPEIWNDRGISCEWTVTFDAQDGTSGEATRAVTNGCAVGELPAATREGFTFDGWFSSAQEYELVIAETVVTNDITFLAQWAINQYVVTFDANGGDGSVTNELDFASGIVAPEVSRTGYTFAGWSPKAGASVPASNVVYTAQWTVNQYTMTFDANGGTGGKTVTQDYGSELAAPTVTRSGYAFTGWSPAVPATVPAGNATYVAQWEINKYTATLELNGGDGDGQIVVEHGTKVGELPVPTRTGHTFAGWFTAASGGTKVTAATRVTGNVTYYAQWLPLSAVRMEGGAKGTATHRTDAKTGVTTFTAKAGGKSSLFAYWLGPDGGKAGFGTTLKVADVGSEGQYVAVFRTKADCAKPTLDANAAFAAGGATMANAVVGVAAGDRFAVPEKCHPATFKASGLPKGLKVDATGGAITGVPTKAGRYTAKVTVTSKANSKWKTTVKVPITIAALPEWAVGQFKGTVSGAAATMSIGSTGKVSGKFTLVGQSWTFSAASFAADSDADGSLVRLVCRATAKTTAKVGGKKTAVSRTLAFALVADPATSGIAAKTVDGAFGDGGAVAFRRVAGLGVTRTGVAAGGTVSLSKAYGQAASGAKVKAAAKLNKGYTFAGWTVRDAAGNDVTAQYVANPLALAVTLTMPGKDLFLEAEFMKEADALAAASLDWDPALAVGFAYKGAPAVTGPAAYKVLSVTGLPKGLAWKKGVVSGTPTVATAGKVAKVKVGLSTNAKKTRTFRVPLVVAALPAFAVGSFEGGSETAGAENRTTLSVTSAGKISGKIAYANATWTASAAGFTSKTADGLFATLTLKNGKKKGTEEICISSLGVVTASRFTARQLLWTTDDTWKGWAAKLVADARAGVEFTNERTGIVATFGKNGVATGVLKVGKSTFTAKATLVPTAIDEHNLEGVLYFSFPANSKKKFKGLVCPVGVEGLAK